MVILEQTDYLFGRVASPTDSLVPITTEPLDPVNHPKGHASHKSD